MKIGPPMIEETSPAVSTHVHADVKPEKCCFLKAKSGRGPYNIPLTVAGWLKGHPLVRVSHYCDYQTPVPRLDPMPSIQCDV